MVRLLTLMGKATDAVCGVSALYTEYVLDVTDGALFAEKSMFGIVEGDCDESSAGNRPCRVAKPPTAIDLAEMEALSLVKCVWAAYA